MVKVPLSSFVGTYVFLKWISIFCFGPAIDHENAYHGIMRRKVSFCKQSKNLNFFPNSAITIGGLKHTRSIGQSFNKQK